MFEFDDLGMDMLIERSRTLHVAGSDLDGCLHRILLQGNCGLCTVSYENLLAYSASIDCVTGSSSLFTAFVCFHVRRRARAVAAAHTAFCGRIHGQAPIGHCIATIDANAVGSFLHAAARRLNVAQFTDVAVNECRIHVVAIDSSAMSVTVPARSR